MTSASPHYRAERDMVDAEDVEVGEVDMREARDGLRREGGAGGVTREKGGRG